MKVFFCPIPIRMAQIGTATRPPSTTQMWIIEMSPMCGTHPENEATFSSWMCVRLLILGWSFNLKCTARYVSKNNVGFQGNNNRSLMDFNTKRKCSSIFCWGKVLVIWDAFSLHMYVHNQNQISRHDTWLFLRHSNHLIELGNLLQENNIYIRF